MSNLKLASTFNDIENKTLQAYNRFQVGVNLLLEYGHATAVRYWKQFSKEDKGRIQQLFKLYEGLSPAEFTRKIKDGTLEVV